MVKTARRGGRRYGRRAGTLRCSRSAMRSRSRGPPSPSSPSLPRLRPRPRPLRRCCRCRSSRGTCLTRASPRTSSPSPVAANPRNKAAATAVSPVREDSTAAACRSALKPSTRPSWLALQNGSLVLVLVLLVLLVVVVLRWKGRRGAMWSVRRACETDETISRSFLAPTTAAAPAASGSKHRRDSKRCPCHRLRSRFYRQHHH